MKRCKPSGGGCFLSLVVALDVNLLVLSDFLSGITFISHNLLSMNHKKGPQGPFL